MKKFRQVFVEITNVCNLSCTFCPKHDRPPRFMTKNEFEKIANELAPITRAVSLHLMGEPLLHPEFDGICKAATERGLQIYLTTNATLIKNHLETLKSGMIIRISVSLHSFEANAPSVSLDKYLSTIFECAKEITKTEHTFVELRLWNQSDNAQAKNALNQYIIDSACKFFNTKIAWDGKNNQFLTDAIYFCPDNVFSWPDETDTATQTHTKYCHALSTHFGILADGTVVACCLDNQGKLALGNAFIAPISQILECERAKRILNGFKSRRAVEPLCKACTFANKFN